MGLRTADEYLAGLRDGREVYFRGKRIPDVTKDPDILTNATHGSVDFSLQFDPDHRDLAVVYDEEMGEEITRLYYIPRNSEDLLKRREVIEYGSRLQNSLVPFLKDIGGDALFTLGGVTPQVDEAFGTNYSARLEAFRQHAAHKDLALAGSVTDVKGDRSRRPSAQDDPDLYVHIVERREDGIVVRGAKVHNSAAPVVDELVVVPTRAMSEEDADYAVAFAIPVNTPGVKVICRTERASDPFEYPISSRHFILEALTVFEDVFVPWDRVFLAGEWQFAGHMANDFGTWHRFTALSYKTPWAELALGTAVLLAQSNGIEKASHIKRNLVELAIYLENMRAYGRAAALDYVTNAAGAAVPNPSATNLGKYYFANRYHEMNRLIQEIAGGLMVTAPAVTDLRNPDTASLINKYLSGAPGWNGIDRMRVMKLAKDLTASEYGGLAQVAAIHAEGSLEAQRISILRECNLEELVEYAKKVSGIGQPVE